MDPWLSQKDKLVGSESGLEEESVLEDKTSGCTQESIPVSFSDNFLPFQKLPDSFQYLASLETKLENIQNSGKKTSRALLRSLEETRESYMVNLLTDSVANGISLEEDSFEELKVNPVLKKLVPEKQALTTEELVHLVKADQLDILLNNDTVESGESAITEETATLDTPKSLNTAESQDENISNPSAKKESPQ